MRSRSSRRSSRDAPGGASRPTPRQAPGAVACRPQTVDDQPLVVEVRTDERGDLQSRSLEVVEAPYVAAVAAAIAMLGAIELGAHLELGGHEVGGPQPAALQVHHGAVDEGGGPAEAMAPDETKPDLLRRFRAFVRPPHCLDDARALAQVTTRHRERSQSTWRAQLRGRSHVDGDHPIIERLRPPHGIAQGTLRRGAPDAVPDHDVGLVDGDATYVYSGAGAEPVAVGGHLDRKEGVAVASETVEVPAPEQAQRRPAGDHPAPESHPLLDDPLLDQPVTHVGRDVEALRRSSPSRPLSLTFRRACLTRGVDPYGPHHADPGRHLRPLLAHPRGLPRRRTAQPCHLRACGRAATCDLNGRVRWPDASPFGSHLEDFPGSAGEIVARDLSGLSR